MTVTPRLHFHLGVIIPGREGLAEVAEKETKVRSGFLILAGVDEFMPDHLGVSDGLRGEINSSIKTEATHVYEAQSSAGQNSSERDWAGEGNLFYR